MKSCWLPSSVCAVLVFNVVYRWENWVGLLVAPLLWKVAWHLHNMKVSPGAATALSLSVHFQVSSSSGVFWLVSKVHCVFSSWDLSFTSGVSKDNRLYALGSLLDSPGQNLKRHFSCLVLGFVCVCVCVLVFGSSVSPVEEKSSLKLHVYLYTEIHTHTHTVCCCYW